MEAHFATMFEDVRHEKLLIFFLSLPDPDKLKQSKITDHEITVIKNFALEKIHRGRILKEKVALPVIEYNFLFNLKWHIRF